MKKYTLIFLILFVLVLSGCLKQEIPEGDIKIFVENMSFNKAYECINTGKSITTSSYYINDELVGDICVTTYIDKIEKLYQYTNTDVSGVYIEENSYHNQQTLTYINDNNEIKAYKKTDNVDNEINYREEDVLTSVNNFFFTSLEGGYHSGGVYYGDYILANCAKYYNCFSLNEEKTELTYQVNTSFYTDSNERIITMHYFVVNTLGMIINLKTKSINVNQNSYIETIMVCEYNQLFDKKVEL